VPSSGRDISSLISVAAFDMPAPGLVLRVPGAAGARRAAYHVYKWCKRNRAMGNCRGKGFYMKRMGVVLLRVCEVTDSSISGFCVAYRSDAHISMGQWPGEETRRS